MSTDILKENDVYVSELRNALQEGEAGLRYVPQFLKRILKEGRWKERIVHQTGEIKTFSRFEEFIADSPPEGLGADLALLMRICADDPEAIDLLDRATVGKPGGLNNPSGYNKYKQDKEVNNNISIIDQKDDRKVIQGTTVSYSIRRLRRERPDLHQRVLGKELSVNAAMVEAGFRKPRRTIVLEPEAAARALIRWFDDSDLEIIVGEILRHLKE